MIELTTILGPPLVGTLSRASLKRLERLWPWLQGYRAKLNVDAVIRAEAARDSPCLYDFLEYHLKKFPTKVGGRAIELMTRKIGDHTLLMPTAALWVGSEVKLGRLETGHVFEDPEWQSSEYVKNQGLFGRVIDDKTVFAADSILPSPGGGVEIRGSLTKYGSALAAQDSLEWELLSVIAASVASGRTSPTDFPKIAESLPLRHKVVARSRSYLANAHHRFNAMAIATVIVYNSGIDGYRVMFKKRSGETAAHADLCHVIPAGMFQPELGDVSVEWNIGHGVLKEYGEELFSKKLEERALDAKYFYSEWPGVASLLSAVDEGKCHLSVTGLIVNLFNLRPEICCLLLVRDAAWWAQQRPKMLPNWEYAPPQSILDKSKRIQSDFSLDSVEQEFNAEFGASAGMWVPPGLATLWLGVDAARRALA